MFIQNPGAMASTWNLHKITFTKIQTHNQGSETSEKISETVLALIIITNGGQ